MNNFDKQLAFQRGFVERSAALFDQGIVEEAIRLAVSFRILFHQTPRSTSLISHLNGVDVKVASFMTPFESASSGDSGTRLIEIWTGPSGIELLPKLQPLHPPRFLSVNSWLRESPLQMQGTLVSRQDLILWAANKDGGAHVDAQLPEVYQQLSTFFMNSDDPTDVLATHYLTIRSMAAEILTSDELWCLSSETDRGV